VLVLLIALSGACSEGSPGSADPSGTAAPSVEPSPSATPFESMQYGYTAGVEWTGTNATAVWDGTGSPGDGDPVVDTMEGPEGQRAFAFGEPWDATLQEFVTASRAANATAHPCPRKPETTRSTTIGGEPAVLDEMHCPVPGGPFTMTAFVVHDGHVNVFFTYSVAPGSEAFTRAWFEPFLMGISFEP
jgi:hypothetical protein